MDGNCPRCKFKKGMRNPARGVKLPGIAQGKCTRSGGFCDAKLRIIENESSALKRKRA